MAVTATTLLIPQGKTWAVAFPVLTPGFDYTGWTVRSQIRARVSSAAVLHEWPSTDAPAGFELVPAEQLRAAGYDVEGTEPVLCVVLRLRPLASSAWLDTWSQGVFDVEVVSPDGTDVIQVARGTAALEREVTR